MSTGWNATHRELEILELRAEINRLRRKLREIHEISQEHNLPAWQVIDNIAATAASALPPAERG